ncbi:heavy-metal-associated domain-containing protein [Mycolicibacterium sp. Y3]
MTRQAFDVEGLRCGGCVNTVRDAMTGLEGVQEVDIDLQPGSVSTVTVESEYGLDADAVQKLLAEHGDFLIRR